jgi:hypothetical protein
VAAFFLVVSKSRQDYAALERGKPLVETASAWLELPDGPGRAGGTMGMR